MELQYEVAESKVLTEVIKCAVHHHETGLGTWQSTQWQIRGCVQKFLD
jgi:hypothetical protein